MKSNLIVAALLILLGISCEKKSEKKETDKIAGSNVIKEYYSNRVVKTEITAVGNLRQGPTRNFDRQGRLLSEVNYVNNVMEGKAINYYAATGKINSSLEYKKGIKEGDEIWYYESGKEYRVTPYIQGKIEGIQKLYYENGKLMAEVPYKNGYAGKGLKEYKQDGTLVTDYPVISIRKENHLAHANKIMLFISLSNDNTGVKFFKGSLLEGKYLHHQLLTLAMQNGSAQMDFNIPPGGMLKQSISIIANYKTPLGNPYIFTKQYNLTEANSN
jgi:antitoxin component YwqK of YwqJK toxin-antitoxin module